MSCINQVKAQGALEYLLLVGGTVLISAVVLSLLSGLGAAGQNQAHSAGTAIQAGFEDLVNISGGSSGQVCGNGFVDLGEECDDTASPQFPTAYSSGLCYDYDSVAYSSGPLICNGCTLDTSSCVMAICGDSIINPSEDCDSGNLNGNDCSSVPGGFDSGTLACDGSCNFDTTLCMDTISPSDVANFSAIATGTTTIDLAWDDPISDSDWEQTMVRRDTVGFPTVSSGIEVVACNSNKASPMSVATPCIDSGLIEGTTYFYSVFTGDLIPNWSVGVNDSELTDYSLKFLHLTDSHIITDGLCTPNFAADGRTDCQINLVDYVTGCDDSDCDWICPGDGGDNSMCAGIADGVSNASRKGLVNAIPVATAMFPDFSVITGDLIAPGPCNNAANIQIKVDSFNLFRSIADGLGVLGTDYFVIGANVHDNVDNCPEYEGEFGSQNINWGFIQKDNFFVGMSEINTGSFNKFNNAYLDNFLTANANQNLKLFVFVHTAFACYDEILGTDFRCDTADSALPIIESHLSDYRSIVILSGHNHANIYELKNGIHHFTTTALMNAPSEFRVIDITKDTINFSMSPVISPAIDAISLEIINGVGTIDPDTIGGISFDRDVFIDLS
jgi:hypothetical protein